MKSTAFGDNDYIRLNAQTRHRIIKVASKNVRREKGEGEVMLTMKAMSYFPRSHNSGKGKDLTEAESTFLKEDFIISLLYRPNAGTLLF